LEIPELWYQFIVYLAESRKVKEICYGQDTFFLDHKARLTKDLPQCSFNYIARY